MPGRGKIKYQSSHRTVDEIPNKPKEGKNKVSVKPRWSSPQAKRWQLKSVLNSVCSPKPKEETTALLLLSSCYLSG